MTRSVLYPLRSVENATVRYTTAPHHRRRVAIDHRPLANVTPDMSLDWFTHLGGTMFYGGVVIDRYLAWHPIDHIRWELSRPAAGGGAAEGARFHIVEAFGGRPAQLESGEAEPAQGAQRRDGTPRREHGHPEPVH